MNYPLKYAAMLKERKELLKRAQDKKGQKATSSLKRPREQLTMEYLAMASPQ